MFDQRKIRHLQPTIYLFIVLGLFFISRLISVAEDGQAAGRVTKSAIGAGAGFITENLQSQVGSIKVVKNADPANGRNFLFELDGPWENHFLTKWGSEGTANGQFKTPNGVVINGAGNVYIVDGSNNRIQVFDNKGNYVTKWGSEGSGDGQFKFPNGLAIDPLGNIYVTDSTNHRIQVFNRDGNYITKWGSEGTGDGQFKWPDGIAIDVLGNVYVADTFNYRIQKFDNVGNFQAKWGTDGEGDGEFDQPRSVAVDGLGYVYVADTRNHRIQKFDSDGNFLTKWGTFGNLGDAEFNGPSGIFVIETGIVFVADSHNNRIQKFDRDGNFLAKFGVEGSADGQFRNPLGIAVDGTGKILIVDSANSRIQKLQLTNFLFYLDSSELDDGDSIVDTLVLEEVPAGNYEITEVVSVQWRLESIECSGGSSDPILNGIVATIKTGEAISCTFSNVKNNVVFVPLILKQQGGD